MARELGPGSANTLSFLAEVRSALGNQEEALKLAVRAVEIDRPRRITGWLSRGPLEPAAIGRGDPLAQSALQAADTPEERQEAQQFLDFAAKRQ